jgi:hypothetical protein
VDAMTSSQAGSSRKQYSLLRRDCAHYECDLVSVSYRKGSAMLTMGYEREMKRLLSNSDVNLDGPRSWMSRDAPAMC